jgi:4-alpha-glucanotransferase
VADPQGNLVLGRAICGELREAERREWWLANGLGGYAAGTLAGSLTRRYHGLLVAPQGEGLGRRLIFAKADATLLLAGRAYPLFTNRWADESLAPMGQIHVESFRLDGRMPVWHFAIGSQTLEMRIWMEPGVHRVYLAYRLLGDQPAKLSIDLLVNNRDHHGNMAAGGFHAGISIDGTDLQVELPADNKLHIQTTNGRISSCGEWYRGFALEQERQRGLPHLDNHFCAGRAELDLLPGSWHGLTAGLNPLPSVELEGAMTRFQQRDARLLSEAQRANAEFVQSPSWIRQLLLAADSFIFARPLPKVPKGESIIAGYPWFGDWGRDTMIALPGLTLVTGRLATAHHILQTFAGMADQGMLPNRFVAEGVQAEYNTVDAALWFFEAWRAYFESSGDRETLKQIFPLLQDMVDWHIRGTRFGIGMDPQDKLLRAGAQGVQLTWMDAKVGDWVVTPRSGKPVEINALWYNALCILADFAKVLKKGTKTYLKLAAEVKQGFQRYLRPDGGLFDLLDGPEGDDAAIRPNQIFAVSLPHSPLDQAAQSRVVTECGRELLTSYGLRSLSPGDEHYRPVYSGGVRERDGAYHQGTVWAWLLGHYALAEYRVTGDAAAAQRRLEPLGHHLADAGIGTISEIFDAEPPHMPRGAPSQAWSVACTLESWWRLERLQRKSEQ